MTQTEPPGGDRAAADSDEDSAAEYVTTRHPVPGDPTVATPGYGERVRRIVAAVLARSPWSRWLSNSESVFGCWDSIDTIDYGAWGFDIIDWLNDEHKMPTHCRGCGKWSPGPDSLACGLCWQCRSKRYER